jgi:hypothetical protein
MQKGAPLIRSSTFWDVDFDDLDWEKNTPYIIGQVFNYGTWDDILQLFRYYGKERIKAEIVNAPWLTDRVLAFWSTYFGIPRNQFKCYIRKQSAPLPWEF